MLEGGSQQLYSLSVSANLEDTSNQFSKPVRFLEACIFAVLDIKKVLQKSPAPTLIYIYKFCSYKACTLLLLHTENFPQTFSTLLQPHAAYIHLQDTLSLF